MRILVTGSAGHVGGTIARYLASQGHQVVGLDLRATAISELADTVELDLAKTTAADAVAQQVARCDAIVHAAATLQKELTAVLVSLANCLGTQQIIGVARDWDVSSFVFLSSVPVIGRPVLHPITEEHPAVPLTAYHASKLFGEHLVRIAATASMAAASLRLTAPVGPGMPTHRILATFVQRAMTQQPLVVAGRGLRIQNYVDVRDVAIAVQACILGRISGVFQVAGGSSISNIDLARLVVGTLGSRSPIELSGEDDPEEEVVWDVSVNQAALAFGYAPQFTLRDTIRDVARHYATHGS